MKWTNAKQKCHSKYLQKWWTKKKAARSTYWKYTTQMETFLAGFHGLQIFRGSRGGGSKPALIWTKWQHMYTTNVTKDCRITIKHTQLEQSISSRRSRSKKKTNSIRISGDEHRVCQTMHGAKVSRLSFHNALGFSALAIIHFVCVCMVVVCERAQTPKMRFQI